MTKGLSIWLFRSAGNGDGFVRAFRSAGFQTLSVPVLSTEFLANVSPFPTDVDAIVVTSRRSVDALARKNEMLADLLEACPATPWFSVGPATGEALSNLGINVVNREPGRASALATDVLESGASRVLFLAGEPHRPELAGMLTSKGIRVHVHTLYATYPVVPFELSRKPGADWAGFFSPMGAETALRVPGIDWSLIHRIAIGPTTADSLRSLGWPPDAIAERPDPESMLRAVSNSISSEQTMRTTTSR